MVNLSYFSEKVRDAEILDEPFAHLEIRDFLHADHLEAVVSDPQIHFAECQSNEELIAKLLEKGFEVHPVGGCIQDVEKYLERLRTGYKPVEPEQNPIDSEGRRVASVRQLGPQAGGVPGGGR